MNRLKDYFDDTRDEDEPASDYYLIETDWNVFVVSRDTALAVERALDKVLPRRWDVFRDLPGARHRVLARSIERVSESTAAQRAASRAFRRARKLEEKADKRPWEDDD
jgi:hypothetical protein